MEVASCIVARTVLREMEHGNALPMRCRPARPGRANECMTTEGIVNEDTPHLAHRFDLRSARDLSA
jgi:hypothetical protein